MGLIKAWMDLPVPRHLCDRARQVVKPAAVQSTINEQTANVLRIPGREGITDQRPALDLSRAANEAKAKSRIARATPRLCLEKLGVWRPHPVFERDW